MQFTAPSSISTLIFLMIVASVIISFLSGVYFSAKKEGLNPKKKTARNFVCLAFWLFLIASVVKSGVLEESPMPRLMIFFVFINLVSIAFTFSPTGTLISKHASLAGLVGFQAFRFPLELVLHNWVSSGTIPSTMSWNGQNFDIISGLLALAFIFFGKENKKLAWIFNLVGFLLLLNVIRVVVLSSPLPFAWNVNPPLLLAFHLPFALIIPVCVSGALAGHIILTRALLKKS